jgi:hypothetical protein
MRRHLIERTFVESCRSWPLVLLALLAACQPLPLPFQPDVKDTNPLLQLDGRAGVLVLPVDGATRPEAMADALAAALRQIDVPASTRPIGRDARRLVGKLEGTRFDFERDSIEASWRLQDAQGNALGGLTNRWLVPRQGWFAGHPQVLAGLAEQLAPSLATLVLGERATAAFGPPVAVWAVDGAPGDGRVALKRAVETALRRHSVRIVNDIGDDTLVLAGAVRLSAAEAGRQRVTVTWTLLRPSGEEIGQVDQDSQVRAGLLDGPWGDVARDVASGAADGIRQLIDAYLKESRS